MTAPKALSPAPIALALALTASAAAAHPRPALDRARVESARSTLQFSTRDLAADEARGGHTLQSHVGRTDEELAERLVREPAIRAASSFVDRPAAERVVGAALAANTARVAKWLRCAEGDTRLVLEHASPAPLGRTLSRGAAAVTECSRARVVLERVPPASFYVLTSYPSRA